MTMSEWAKKEVEIACSREREGSENEEVGMWDYGCACYGSALKAFNSLLEDGHSGMSIGFTKNILNRLIDGKPLTPIEDTDDVWVKSFHRSDGTKVYQCERMSSLFKDIHPDGSITYSDNNRIRCVNISDPGVWYSNGFVNSMINEIFPISMPYMPEDKPFVVYCADFLTDSKNGDYDTMGILYAIKPDGERIDIYRYFKESGDSFIEIDELEYSERELMAITRKQKEAQNA